MKKQLNNDCDNVTLSYIHTNNFCKYLLLNDCVPTFF